LLTVRSNKQANSESILSESRIFYASPFTYRGF
jgi:hypothetical protein